MSETIEYIKRFNIGDKVTSTKSILLDRGFRGVTGTVRTIVKYEADSWQYLIDLEDGRELQCDDCHLEKKQLSENQLVVLEWLKENGNQYDPFSTLDDLTGEVFYTEGFKTCIYVAFSSLTAKEKFQVLDAFVQRGLKEWEDGNEK